MRILLIDDHALFAKSLEIALEGKDDIEKFQSVSEIMQVIPTIQKEHPDIVLLDINLTNISNEDGLDLAKDILRAECDTKIVILTGYDLPVYRYEAQKIGAKGFINKNVDPEELIFILTKIKKGQTFFSQNVDYIEELTPCEKHILQMLCEGVKRKDIANQLYISERTVSNHLQHIFSKFDVSNSLEAVTKALQLGYITASL